MLLMNLHTLSWDSELLEFFGIPPSILPNILPNVSDYGTLQLGRDRLPIRASIGDQQAALLGLGAVQTGDAVVNYGTGGFLLVNTGPKPLLLSGLLSSLAWMTKEETAYVIEGTVNAVGTVFEWLKQMGFIQSHEEIDQVLPSSHEQACFVPSLSGLGAPHWMNEVKMSILGLGPLTSKADLVRSAVEGIAFLIKDIHEVIRKEGRVRIKKLMASGGGSRIKSLVQTQADWLGLPILQSRVTEATVLGAAFLAGVGSGWWRSPSEVPKVQAGKVFRPRLSEAERDRLYQQWKKALEAIRVFGKG